MLKHLEYLMRILDETIEDFKHYIKYKYEDSNPLNESYLIRRYKNSHRIVYNKNTKKINEYFHKIKEYDLHVEVDKFIDIESKKLTEENKKQLIRISTLDNKIKLLKEDFKKVDSYYTKDLISNKIYSIKKQKEDLLRMDTTPKNKQQLEELFNSRLEYRFNEIKRMDDKLKQLFFNESLFIRTIKKFRKIQKKDRRESNLRKKML